MFLEKALPLVSEKLSGLIDGAHIAIGLFFLRLLAFSEQTRSFDLLTPSQSKWSYIQSNRDREDIGVRLNDVMATLETEKPVLQGKLFKDFTGAELSNSLLRELIDLISSVDIRDTEDTDTLGQIYEYFLGQFAATEGRKGGQFYTPESIIRMLVSIVKPNNGSLYDPCCGSGGMFLVSGSHAKSLEGQLELYGQEINPTTWRLTAMNLAMRGYAIDLGAQPANTLKEDQFSNCTFDYILANPPFNVSNWHSEDYENDRRWIHGVPPANNSNYAWLEHIATKLSDRGMAGVVLANSALSSSNKQECQIRRGMLEDDLIEVLIALPPQLFTNTQIPVCLWILSRNKRRKGEFLFIDGRSLGSMVSRKQKAFFTADIDKVKTTIDHWRSGALHEHQQGFSGVATLQDIEALTVSLTPGRYVKIGEQEQGEPLSEKLPALIQNLKGLQEEGAALDKKILSNLTVIADNI